MIKYNKDRSKAKITGLITSITEKLTKNNSPYCQVQLTNEDFSVVILSIWSCTKEQLKLHTVLSSVCSVNSQGISTTFSSTKCTPITEPFTKVLPMIPTLDEYHQTIAACCHYIDPKQKSIFKALADYLYPLYVKGTAATTNHHNFKGGLLLHTYEMLNIANVLHNVLPFNNDHFIVCVAILFHDYGKLFEYSVTDDSIEITPQMTLQGHPFLSAEYFRIILQTLGINLSEDLITHIQHCILAHHGFREWGSPVVPSTPEAFLVHHIDMLSGTGTTFKQTPSGIKSFSLNTTVYKHEVPNT